MYLCEISPHSPTLGFHENCLFRAPDTGYQSGIALLTLPVNNNLHTCNCSNRQFRQHQQRGTTVRSRHAIRVVRKNRFTTEVHQNLASNATSKYFFIMNIGRGKVTCVSIAHMFFGAIMLICGILQIEHPLKYLWLDSLYAGIWAGMWVSHTHQY